MNILMQICVVLAVCLLGEAVSAVLPIPFPSSVIAMVLLLALLFSGLLKPHHIRQKADFLAQNMALFFVPSSVAILRYADVLWQNLVPILVICFVTTPLVFAATAWAVKGTVALMERKGARHHE